jgi:hypothetical protein
MSKKEFLFLRVRIGEPFPIELGGCYACGYHWVIDYDHSAFHEGEEESVCPPGMMPGQSCKIYRNFYPLRQGKFQITGLYLPPGKTSPSEEGSITVWNINVK